MKTIIVTGTPGTGKTYLSRKLAGKLNFYYFDVNKFVSQNRLYEGYDKKRKTKIVDIKKLNSKLMQFIDFFKKNKIKKYSGIIIDSHLSHYLPKKYVDLCIITKCDVKKLYKRLKRKKFHKSKIQENLQSEIFDICLNEAKQRKHKIIVIDTTKGFNINTIARNIGG